MLNQAKICVYPEQTKFDLQPDMYGVFFEEINHSGEGGLYAELVRNRSFQDAVLPEGTTYYDGRVATSQAHMEPFSQEDLLPGWRCQTAGNTTAEMEPWVENPRNPEVPNQLMLTVQNTAEGSAVLLNEGFWGMSLEPQNYRLTLILRSDRPMGLQAQLRDAADRVLVSVPLAEPLSSAFEKRTLLLPVSCQADGCRLALVPESDGVIWFDFVSLFPEHTYKNRENGLNPRLAEMIEGLHPKFLRFPGGCVVEGFSLENAFLAMDTVGPIEDRKGRWNLWGYRRTDGLGYHEFLQFCEDLGACAMFVFNCGMSCQHREAEFADQAGIDAFLQDAIHAIDYALAPVTDPWGALRAKAGHPEPFDLKYVEIGNENKRDAYMTRYNYLYRILKERYPRITFIMDKYLELEKVLPDAVEMIDEHYYLNPQTMVQNAHQFDGRDRNGPKYYIGELSANWDVGIGNLAGAVAEASYLINLERNGDLVQKVSYAPLLCHQKDRVWPVNMICFQDHRVFGIPSYYVFRLFAENLGKTIVNTTVQVSSFSREARVHAQGSLAENGDLILKFMNFSFRSTRLTIDAGDYVPFRLEEISSDSPEDTNSLDEPCKVCIREVPAASELTMKPYSVFVMRLKKP